MLLLYWNIYSSFFQSFIFVANTYLFTSVTMLVSVSLLYAFSIKMSINTAWKVSKYGVFSGPYFPTFGLNTPYLSAFSPNSGNTDQKKLRIWTLWIFFCPRNKTFEYSQCDMRYGIWIWFYMYIWYRCFPNDFGIVRIITGVCDDYVKETELLVLIFLI